MAGGAGRLIESCLALTGTKKLSLQKLAKQTQGLITLG